MSIWGKREGRRQASEILKRSLYYNWVWCGVRDKWCCVTSRALSSLITDRFSGPGRATGRSMCVCVCVCLYIQTITFELSNIWGMHVAYSFTLTLKTKGQSARLRDEKFPCLGRGCTIWGNVFYRYMRWHFVELLVLKWSVWSWVRGCLVNRFISYIQNSCCWSCFGVFEIWSVILYWIA